MRNTYTRDPGGWNYAQKNSEAGPGGGAGFPKDPGGGMGMYDPNPGGGYMKDPGTGI